MADGTRKLNFVSGLQLRIGKRWFGPIPCGALCIANGGLLGSYRLLHRSIIRHDPLLDMPFLNAHGWQLSTMKLSIIFVAILLPRCSSRTRVLGLIGLFLNIGHALVAIGVHESHPAFLNWGCGLIGSEIGTLYALGVKLLLAWIPESYTVPAMIALASYVFGHLLSELAFPFLLRYLHVVTFLYLSALLFGVLGIFISDNCLLPADSPLDRSFEGTVGKAGAEDVNDIEGQQRLGNGKLWERQAPSSRAQKHKPIQQSTTALHNSGSTTASYLYSDFTNQPSICSTVPHLSMHFGDPYLEGKALGVDASSQPYVQQTMHGSSPRETVSHGDMWAQPLYAFDNHASAR